MHIIHISEEMMFVDETKQSKAEQNYAFWNE